MHRWAIRTEVRGSESPFELPPQVPVSPPQPGATAPQPLPLCMRHYLLPQPLVASAVEGIEVWLATHVTEQLISF